MDQSFQTFFEFDKDAEVYQASHFAGEFITQSIVSDNIFLVFGLRTLFRENQFAFLGTNANDSDRELLSYQFFEFIEDFVFVAVGDARIVLWLELACREKASET